MNEIIILIFLLIYKEIKIKQIKKQKQKHKKMSTVCSLNSLDNSNTATRESSPLISDIKHKPSKFKENFEIASINQRINIDTVIIFISDILQDIIKENSQKKNKNFKNSFYMNNPPKMSFLLSFTKRLTKYLKPECSTLIISLMYIDNLLNRLQGHLFLTENNVLKILLTSLVCAIKYNEDMIHDNEFFAKVGGINLKEMNLLEREFLFLMEYKLYIPKDMFKVYEENFEVKS